MQQIAVRGMNFHDTKPRVTGATSCLSKRRNHYLNLILRDRKSTRLNSSHANISYAVFCLKKKKKERKQNTPKYCKKGFCRKKITRSIKKGMENKKVRMMNQKLTIYVMMGAMNTDML